MKEESKSSAAKSFTPPLGFKFAAVAAGVREAGAARRDLALVASEMPASGAGVLTVNRMPAAGNRPAARLTGAIGVRLPIERITAAAPALVAAPRR